MKLRLNPIKSDGIEIIGSNLTFKFTLTDSEDIVKAVGKITVDNQSASKSRVWVYEKLKREPDKDSGRYVPVSCTLVYNPRGDFRGTSKSVAEQFKKMIK